MRSLLFSIVFVLSAVSYGQGNLQFNQVINQSFNGNGGNLTIIGIVTVPAGKVWKIESANYSYLSAGYRYTQKTTSSNAMVAYIGDNLIWDGTMAKGSLDLFPIWLSTGSYNVMARSSNTLPSVVNFSAIEFNVVP
jgi:hypothetical protein